MTPCSVESIPYRHVLDGKASSAAGDTHATIIIHKHQPCDPSSKLRAPPAPAVRLKTRGQARDEQNSSRSCSARRLPSRMSGRPPCRAPRWHAAHATMPARRWRLKQGLAGRRWSLRAINARRSSLRAGCGTISLILLSTLRIPAPATCCPRV